MINIQLSLDEAIDCWKGLRRLRGELENEKRAYARKGGVNPPLDGALERVEKLIVKFDDITR